MYSIDEAFFDLHGIAEPLDDYGRRIGRTIRRNTGIPVSIGIAPTKTLAKIASKLAKRYPKLDGCCYMHRPEDIEKVLATFPLHEVWGIGRRYGKLFDSMRITTARQFVELPEEWIHSAWGLRVCGRGASYRASSASASNRCRSRSSRSPSRAVPQGDLRAEELERIVAEFASMCAEKLRAQRALCGQIHGFIFTNRHRDDQPQRYETAVLTLPEPTDSTLEIVRQARAALRQIYRPRVRYKKSRCDTRADRTGNGRAGHSVRTARQGEARTTDGGSGSGEQGLWPGQHRHRGTGNRAVPYEPRTSLAALYDRLAGAADRKGEIGWIASNGKNGR